MRVRKKWRVGFRFPANEAVDANLLHYHWLGEWA